MDNKNMQSNVFKTALLFEGGSMRASYSSAVASWLLERGVYFDRVYSVSAGSSNCVNYLSRDIFRTRVSFTDFIGDPRMGNWKSMAAGKGLMNAHYIYQEAGLPDGIIPFDFQSFAANPAQCCVVSFNRDTGEDLYFGKEDMQCLNDLMLCVRASSTLPLIMPSPKVRGCYCYDGGFARGGGLPLRKIEEDGYDRVVVVRTRKRGFRKERENQWGRVFFWNKPKMAEAMVTRWQRYNEACDELDQWEKDGRAYVFYCDDLTVGGMERDVALLQANFDAGYEQIKRDWKDMLAYIEASEAR